VKQKCLKEIPEIADGYFYQSLGKEGKTMDRDTYDVVLTGSIEEGYERAEVITAAASLLKCSSERAEQLFQGKPVTLKRALDNATAIRYRDHLLKAGIGCRVEPVEKPNLGLELALESSESNSTPTDASATEASSTADSSATRANNPGEQFQRGSDQEIPETDEWDEIGLYVGHNLERYERKFRAIYQHDGSYQVAWHWPAFFVPIPWFIYRKLYPWAAGLLIVQFFLPPIAQIGLGIATGMMGNYIYYQAIVRKLRKLTLQGEERQDAIVQAGGTNSLLLTIGATIAIGFVMTTILYRFYTPPVMKQTVERTQQMQKEIADVGNDPTRKKMMLLHNVLVLRKLASKAVKREFHVPQDMAQYQAMTKLSDKAISDKWGSPMRLSVDGNKLTFLSAGEDKIFFSDDDVKLETKLQ
jgi:hypothetical protein